MKIVSINALKKSLQIVKSALAGKEPAFSKNSGFNLTRTDAVEDNPLKVFTSKGALNLKNELDNKKLNKTGDVLSLKGDALYPLNLDLGTLTDGFARGLTFTNSAAGGKSIAGVGLNVDYMKMGMGEEWWSNSLTVNRSGEVYEMGNKRVWSTANFDPNTKLNTGGYSGTAKDLEKAVVSAQNTANLKLNKAGDTMTGDLVLGATSALSIKGGGSGRPITKILTNHGNGNVTISGNGGDLYLGYNDGNDWKTNTVKLERDMTVGGTTVVNMSKQLFDNGNRVYSRSNLATEIRFKDTRGVNYNPEQSDRTEFKVTFQQNGTNSVSDGGSYYTMMHIPRYTDPSGGFGNQIIFTDNNHMWFRRGINNTTWSAWEKVWTDREFNPNTKLNTSGGTISGGLTVNGKISAPGRIVANATSNDYNGGGLEILGNGSANNIKPTLGFHQPGLFASSIQLAGAGDFRFHTQGVSDYADVRARNFYPSGSIHKDLSGSWIAGRDNSVVSVGCTDSSYASAWRSRGGTYTFTSGVLGNSQGGFYVYRNDRTANGTDGYLYLSSSGYTYSARVYNAVWNDYAEYFPKKEGYITEAGDIIALSETSDEEIYELATEEHNVIVGAHSDEYGMLIGGDTKPDDFEGESEDYNSPRYIPVGLVGRLRVKVIGSVKKGTKIVPSNIPGVGRAFDKTKDDYDKVIGYVVENNNEEGIRRVKIKIGK